MVILRRLHGVGNGKRDGLGGALALVAVTGAALFASATAGEPQRPPTAVAGGPTLEAAQARAEALTPRVAERVERIRGLEFETVPDPEVITAERFAELSAAAVNAGPRLRRELGDSESVARLLGLMRPHDQLDELLTGASDLAAAAYDTERERLYVIYDASGADEGMLEFLLAHELTHALEDQRFGLDEEGATTDDEALAELALIEGTATAVMIEYAGRHLDPLALAAASAAFDPGTDGVPRFYVQALTWAYLGGAELVAALLDDGDDRWRAIDRALGGRPPRSTEQVLHPAAYRSRDRPVEVEAELGSAARAGWRVVYRGTLGEYSTAQILRLGAPAPIAERAAAGWEGDAFALASRDRGGSDCEHACRRSRALAVTWRWESARDRSEFARTVPVWLVGALGGREAAEGVWRLDDGWAVLTEDGRRAGLGMAPGLGLARALAG